MIHLVCFSESTAVGGTYLTRFVRVTAVVGDTFSLMNTDKQN